MLNKIVTKHGSFYTVRDALESIAISKKQAFALAAPSRTLCRTHC